MGYTTCPLTPEDCTLYNLTRLAGKLGVSYDYVKEMKKMGFELPYGGMTTLTHALNWINANPDFRADARILKCSVRPKHHVRPQRQASGRYGSPRLKRDSRSSSPYSLEPRPESVG